MTCDGRLFHGRVAATGNALSLTVDRRVRRKSRDVDEAEADESSKNTRVLAQLTFLTKKIH